MKKNRLKNLVIKELSLVTRPANQGSYSILHKSDDMPEPTEIEPKGLFAALKKFLTRGNTNPDEETFEKTHPEVTAGFDAFEMSVASAFMDDDLGPQERAAAIRKSAEEFCDAVVGEVVGKGDGNNSESTNAPGGEENMAKNDQADDVLKGVPDAVRERITKAEEANKALADRIEKMESDRKEAEVQSIAKGLVGEIGVESDKVASVLKQLDDAGREVLKSIFTKANAVIKGGAKALTVELGGDTAPTSAVTKLDTAVAEIQKSDPKLTKQQAVAKALDANPALYDELNAA